MVKVFSIIMAFKSVVTFITMLVCVHCNVVVHREQPNVENASAILPDTYIAGGQPAEIGQFPWIARLVIRSRSERASYLCGGSLISKRHVLTAAHCLEHEVKYYQDISIYLGEYDTKSFPKDCAHGKCTKNVLTYPDKIMKHSDYDSSTISNDIALLRLQKVAPRSAHIQPVPLPPFDVDHPGNNGVSLAIVGWGETESLDTSNVLLATELSLIPANKCREDRSNVPAKHLCAGNINGKDTCPGDSGGPLLMHYNNKFYLSGIVSYGPDMKCGTAKAGFYTNVYKYIKWIKKHMKS